ncbi:MAG: electron transport complex subunit RsxE, partial [Gammaproteobacteria bacterium]|nr:electron transport complex subunit RsxE [Gammaproteobacteria bacterium]
GNGTLLGFQVMPANFEPWVVMILPPGGFFVLGSWLLLFAYIRQRQDQRALEKGGVSDAR